MSDNEEFEERLGSLLRGDPGSARAVSANAVITGAERRRSRHRAAVAGTSLAVLAVAGSAVALGAGSGGRDGNPAQVEAVPTKSSPTPTATSSRAEPTSAQPSGAHSLSPEQIASISAANAANADVTEPPNVSTLPLCPETHQDVGVSGLEPDLPKVLGPAVALVSGEVKGHKWAVCGKVVKSVKAFEALHPSAPMLLHPMTNDYTAFFWYMSIDGKSYGGGSSDVDHIIDPADPGHMPLTTFGDTDLLRYADEMAQCGQADNRIDHYLFEYKGQPAQTVPVEVIEGYHFVAYVDTPTHSPSKVTAYDAQGHVVHVWDGLKWAPPPHS